MSEHILMDGAAINRTLTRLSHEVVEKAKGAENLCLIGIPRRGEIVAARVRTLIEKFYGASLPCAGIDIGMYRDDLVSGYFVPDARVNSLGFSVDGKTVILCDDVLHTGRTVRAAIRRSSIWADPPKSCCSSCATAAEGKCPSVPILWGRISPLPPGKRSTCALRKSKGRTASVSPPKISRACCICFA